jgi:hypothetical protein
MRITCLATAITGGAVRLSSRWSLLRGRSPRSGPRLAVPRTGWYRARGLFGRLGGVGQGKCSVRGCGQREDSAAAIVDRRGGPRGARHGWTRGAMCGIRSRSGCRWSAPCGRRARDLSWCGRCRRHRTWTGGRVERRLNDLAPLEQRLWLVVDDVHELDPDQALRQRRTLAAGSELDDDPPRVVPVLAGDPGPGPGERESPGLGDWSRQISARRCRSLSMGGETRLSGRRRRGVRTSRGRSRGLFR